MSAIQFFSLRVFSILYTEEANGKPKESPAFLSKDEAEKHMLETLVPMYSKKCLRWERLPVELHDAAMGLEPMNLDEAGELAYGWKDFSGGESQMELISRVVTFQGDSVDAIVNRIVLCKVDPETTEVSPTTVIPIENIPKLQTWILTEDTLESYKKNTLDLFKSCGIRLTSAQDHIITVWDPTNKELAGALAFSLGNYGSGKTTSLISVAISEKYRSDRFRDREGKRTFDHLLESYMEQVEEYVLSYGPVEVGFYPFDNSLSEKWKEKGFTGEKVGHWKDGQDQYFWSKTIAAPNP